MEKNKRFKLIIKYTLLSIGVFAFSVIISIITRMILVNDTEIFGFTESQAALIASMIEGIVGALSAGIVVYQLKAGDIVEERQNDIEEAKFILEYNQSFIKDEKMCEVEQQLEKDMLLLQSDKGKKHDLITDDNRQQFINYLVYLEGVAPLVLRGVLQLEHIDDLMAYRFFLAMNNPTLQEDQLKVFPDYYRGCFKLYKKWKQFRLEKGREILNEEYSIDKWTYFQEFSSDICIRNVLPTDDVNSIAELIYKTDPYIYPTAFGNLRKAKKHIPNFLSIESNPYFRKNIKLAVADDEIVGLVVILKQSPKTKYKFEEYTGSHPDVPKNYLHTATNYFNSIYEYLENDEDVYIPCVCVKETSRGKHIGKLLVLNAIRECSDKNIHLHVLCENERAIQLYEKCGFKKISQNEGYSISEHKPKCLKMTYYGKGVIRNAIKTN